MNKCVEIGKSSTGSSPANLKLKANQLTAKQEQIYKKLSSILDECISSLQTYGSYFFEKEFEEEEKNNIEYLREFLSCQKKEDLELALNFQREDGATMLHNVADFHPEVTKLLLKAGANPNIQDKDGRTPLHYAITYDCSGNIQALLDLGADPDIQDKEGNTPLHIAAECDYQISAELLLNGGANPNIEDKDGNTPLRSAIVGERINIVELFLENEKTDINFIHKQTKEPPIFDAVATKATGGKMVDLILRSGKVDLSIRNKKGVTVLHEAACYGQSNIINSLLAQGANVDDIDNKSRNTLHFAVCNERKESDSSNYPESRECGFDYEEPNANVIAIISTLITHLVKDVSLCIKEKVQKGEEIDNEIYEINKRIGDFINAENKNGNTPLFFAVERGKREIITKLLIEGGETERADRNGYTPLHYAIKNKDYETLRLLVFSPIDLGLIENEIRNILMQDESTSPPDLLKLFMCSEISIAIVNKILPSITYKDLDADFIENQIEAILPRNMKENEEFCSAAKYKISQILIENAKNIYSSLNTRDKEGNTLLHHAVKWGCGEKVLDFLVERGVDINAKNNNGVVPIHIAAKYGDISFINFFVRNGADLNIQCGKFTEAETDLLEKNFVTVRDGINDAVDIQNDTRYENATPVFIAVDSLNKDAEYALSSQIGVNVNIADSIGATPLHVITARILNKDYKKCEREEVYEMFRRLALFSIDDLLWCKKFIEIFNGDEKEKQELRKILIDIEEPTAPMCEEASAPSFDDNFYSEIDIKEIPNLHYYNLSHELKALAVDDWKVEYECNNIEAVKIVIEEPEDSEQAENLEIRDEDEWGKEGDISKVSGASVWSNAPRQNIKLWNEDKQEESDVKSKDVEKEELATAIDKNEPARDINKHKADKKKKSVLGQTKLMVSEQNKLQLYMVQVGETVNMEKLEEVVNEALKAGVRLNFSQDERYHFASCVIKKIYELNSIEKNPKVASKIVCKLVSKGALLDGDYKKIDKQLEKLLKNHSVNIQKANSQLCKRINEFQRVVKSAISQGELKNLEIDNTTFCLECSEDSIVNVARVINGAKGLGLSQGDMTFGGNIIKVGKNEVEFEVKNGIRNYTGISDGSDLIMTFYTSQGELEVRLYSDAQDKEIVRVEYDKDKFDLEQLISHDGKTWGNCLFNELPLYDVLMCGFFKKSGRRIQLPEANLSKQTKEEVGKIMKGSEESIVPSTKDSNNWSNGILAQRNSRATIIGH